MSVDFAKYNYTVKENVGTGNIQRQDDIPLLQEALRKGGADAVVRRLPRGLDEELNKDWIPPSEELVETVDNPVTQAPASKVLATGKTKAVSTTTKPTADHVPTSPAPPALSAASALNIPIATRRGRGRGTFSKQLKASRDAKPLSGGQWQRIALARAFMRSDEADLVVFE